MRILTILLIVFSVAVAPAADKKTPAKNTKPAGSKAGDKKKAKKKWDWRKSLPNIGYVYPAGAQQGTELEIIIGGQRLRNVDVSVSGSGVEVLSVEILKPLRPQIYRGFGHDFACELCKRYNVELDPPLERRLKRAQENVRKSEKFNESNLNDHPLLKNFDTMPRRHMEIMAKYIFTIPNGLQKAPAIQQLAIAKLRIAKDASPGMRELRVWAPRRGLSNPLHFYIGTLPEFTEQRLYGPTEKMKTNVTLPAIINGQVMPSETDSFLFHAKKGQGLVFAVMARNIIPYLGDAVPGWFQPVVSIHDKKGKELAYEDDFRCSPDPVVFFKAPADGQYELRIRDSIYRGRSDFVYRIKAGEYPFITGIFPLGVKANQRTTLKLSGYNLKKDKIHFKAPADINSIYRIPGIGDSVFNPVSILVDSLPTVLDSKNNDSIKTAQAIKIGTIINGVIDSPDDVDVFKISGKAGQQVVFDVKARQLGSPLDAVISLRYAKGNKLFTTDDMANADIGTNTHKADPYMMFTLPENGDYYLFLRDVQNHGGKDFAYTLRISRPRPDFKVYAEIASFNIRRWQKIGEKFRVVRTDGFNAPVIIKDSNQRTIFKISNGKIIGYEGLVDFQLRNRRKGPSKPPFPVYFIGETVINGKTVTRKVIPCDDMMQAFIYHHWVGYDNFMAYINRW